MGDIKWVGNHIEVSPPKKPKKITGTRFATLLGLNPWSTPFEQWCEITKTYCKPFEDTIFTVFGKEVEPKQASYMVESYGMDNLIRPSDIWGEDYFKKTYGDFFKEQKILGGMWDYLLVDENNVPTTVLEMKTSKRVEDWQNDVPEYYALQASLYAYLLGVDDVIMVASFPDPDDYNHPENFVPNATNTITVSFKVSERYPDFAQKIQENLDWWNKYVVTGISPDYDEKKDAEILKILRTNNVNPDTDLTALLDRADELQQIIDRQSAKLSATVKELDAIKKQVKSFAMEQFRDGDNKVTFSSRNYHWELSKSETVKLDEDAMEQDGIIDKYLTKVSTSYRFTAKAI